MHPSHIYSLVLRSYFPAMPQIHELPKLYFYEYWYFPGNLSNAALRCTSSSDTGGKSVCSHIQCYHSYCVFLIDFSEQGSIKLNTIHKCSVPL